MITTTNTVNTTPNLTLKEAVVEAVKGLKSNIKVSARNITDSVRAAVNSGEIALPGHEAKPNQNGIKYWVKSEDVKEVIDTLLEDGTLANLGMTNVDYSGNYRVFEFVPVVVDNDEVAAEDPATMTVAEDPTQSPVEAKIEAYLSNAGSATLKQIQSALKINGLTCENLYDLIRGLGYTVEEGTSGCFSTYTVSE